MLDLDQTVLTRKAVNVDPFAGLKLCVFSSCGRKYNSLIMMCVLLLYTGLVGRVGWRRCTAHSPP